MSLPKARYDSDGNIILPSPQSGPTPAEAFAEIVTAAVRLTEPDERPVDALQWGLVEEPSEDISELPIVQRAETTRRIRDELGVVRESCAEALGIAQENVVHAARSVLAEGERQLLSGIDDGLDVSRSIVEEIRESLRDLGRFLTQPVLVPGFRVKVKQTNRTSLFLFDILRFGGTFATIFVVLFSAMNYQSFVAIAYARIEPILAFTNLDGGAVRRSLADKLRQVPTLPTAGESEGLAAYIPPVGPPEDLLIIPSLRLSAPIVSPSTDSLIKEDWKALETDIQESLERGVVHYPGTAEPGQAGNFFVTGHSSYFPWAEGDYKSIFARLGELKIGDEYWVYHGGDKYRYVIESKKEIVPSDVSVLEQPIDKRMATLMTCTPVGTTLRRLILIAKEVDPTTGDDMDVGQLKHAEDRPDIKLEALPI